MHRILPVLSLVVLASLAPPAMAEEISQKPTISIEGKGEVVAPPDTAAVTAGVTSEGKTAREALDANTKAMASLIATLKTAQIEPRDIQTAGFSVNPQYVYPEKPANGDAPRIVGYTVQNTVSVRVRKLDELGQILDGMVSAGGNTVNGVSFSVDDPKKLFEEARKAAFADAEDKAKTYADAAGARLGSVLSITEAQGVNPPRPVMMKAMAPAAGAAPIEAGQLTFDIDVSVVWELRTASN